MLTMLFALYVFLSVFLTTGAMAVCLQLAAYVVLRFTARSLYRRINAGIAYLFWSTIITLVERWAKVRACPIAATAARRAPPRRPQRLLTPPRPCRSRSSSTARRRTST